MELVVGSPECTDDGSGYCPQDVTPGATANMMPNGISHVVQLSPHNHCDFNDDNHRLSQHKRGDLLKKTAMCLAAESSNTGGSCLSLS